MFKFSLRSLLVVVLVSGPLLYAAFLYVPRFFTTEPASKLKTVLVATEFIQMYEEITSKNTTIEHWPESVVPKTVVSSLPPVDGKYSKTRIGKGMPLGATGCMTAEELVVERTITLKPGVNCVPLEISQEGGLLNKGDKVDILKVVGKKRVLLFRSVPVESIFRWDYGYSAGVFLTDEQTLMYLQAKQLHKIQVIISNQYLDDDGQKILK